MVHKLMAIRVCSLLLAFCGILVVNSACAQQMDPCLNMQSQSAMNNCEAEQYAKADADLNHVYRKLLSKYQSDPQFLQKLRLAQDAWLKFRDADLDSIYYQKDKLQAYGSVYPMCRAILLTRATIERTKELTQMLNPEEGDVCGFAASEAKSTPKQPAKVGTLPERP